jgi:hypothetical protein
VQTVRLPLTENEIQLLEKARLLGFHSAPEVVRCAALSLIRSSGMELMTDSDPCLSAALPLEPITKPHDA